jgi:hypothetical protein
MLLTSDASTDISAGDHASESVFSMYNTGTNFMINIGNIYGATGSNGIAIFDNYGTKSKLFEISSGSTGLVSTIGK